MKKYILILILVFSSFLMAKNYNFGLKVGGTYSNADFYYYDSGRGGNQAYTDNNYYWGTFFSVYGNVNISELFFIQVEGNLNQKGLEFKIDGDRGGATKVTFQLFEFVLLIKLNVKFIRPYIGIFRSFTLYKKYSDDLRESDRIYKYDENTDMGYTVGFDIPYKKYLIDFRFSKGFNKIWGVLDDEHWSYYDNSRQFVLSFGYEF